MKATGIVRQIDELGRIVLPMELRKIMNIRVKDSLEVFVSEEGIVLKKYEIGCIFCDEREGLTEFKGKYICPACLEQINK